MLLNGTALRRLLPQIRMQWLVMMKCYNGHTILEWDIEKILCRPKASTTSGPLRTLACLRILESISQTLWGTAPSYALPKVRSKRQKSSCRMCIKANKASLQAILVRLLLAATALALQHSLRPHPRHRLPAIARYLDLRDLQTALLQHYNETLYRSSTDPLVLRYGLHHGIRLHP